MKRLRPRSFDVDLRIDPNASNAREQIDALSLPDDVWRTTVNHLRPWELIWLSRTCQRMLRLCGPGTPAWCTEATLRYRARLVPMVPQRWLCTSPYFLWSAVLDSFDTSLRLADADWSKNRDDEMLPFRTQDYGALALAEQRPSTAALDDALTMNSRIVCASFAMANVAKVCLEDGHPPNPGERCCSACSDEFDFCRDVYCWTAMRFYRCREPRVYFVSVFVVGSTHIVNPADTVVFPVGPVEASTAEEMLALALDWHSVARPRFRAGEDFWAELWPCASGERVDPEAWNESLQAD